MEESYRPGDLPYPEQNDRKKFCEFHYKGVLIVLIPIVFCPILFGPESHAYRMLYLTVCIYLYYIFNVMSVGAIAFLYIVFVPLLGITSSKALTTAHYADLMFETFGSVFIGIAMDASKLSDRLSIYVIDFVGGNVHLLQMILMLFVIFGSIVVDSTLVAAFWMKITQAVVAEYGNAGLLEVNNGEETYERQTQLYPSLPVVGLFLTVCYSATLGAMLSPFQNPNEIMIFIFKIFMPKAPGGFMKVLILPVILGAIVVSLWINTIFLGLLGGKQKEKVTAVKAGGETMRKAMVEKRNEIGPWSTHSILASVLILLLMLALFLRRPSIFPGWADQIHLVNCGGSVAIILVCVLLFCVAANYLFCRYYICRQPENPGVAPSLVSWKACNQNTPWAHIFMLGAADAFAFLLKESGMLDIIQGALVRKELDVGFSLFIGSLIATVFTMLSPATSLARLTLLSMFKTGVLLKNGVGSVAVPYGLSLHNQFMLPCSTAGNTIISGWGNVRPYLYLLGGIVPTLFMLMFICVFIKAFGEGSFPRYLKHSYEDFQYTYKP